jgi:hypothetical protein
MFGKKDRGTEVKASQIEADLKSLMDEIYNSAIPPQEVCELFVAAGLPIVWEPVIVEIVRRRNVAEAARTVNADAAAQYGNSVRTTHGKPDETFFTKRVPKSGQTGPLNT